MDASSIIWVTPNLPEKNPPIIPYNYNSTHLITNTATKQPGDYTVSPDGADNWPSPAEPGADTPEEQQTTDPAQEERGGDKTEFEGAAVEVELAERECRG